MGADHIPFPLLPPSPSVNGPQQSLGHRLVVMAGGVLISTGMVIASFARSVVDMYITIGVISGELSYSCTSEPFTLPRLPAKRGSGHGGVLLTTTWEVLEKHCWPS